MAGRIMMQVSMVSAVNYKYNNENEYSFPTVRWLEISLYTGPW